MATSHHIDNPFDTGRDILKILQSQVADLQDSLRTEQTERRQDVDGLRASISQEVEERHAHVQKLEHHLAQELHRLEQPQHRLRFDMGDLRMAIDKAHDVQKNDCHELRKDLSEASSRLATAIAQLKADHDLQGERLTNALELETQNRGVAIKGLDSKLSAEDDRLLSGVETNASNFAEYKRHMDDDYGKTKESTHYLIRDLDYIFSNMRSVGLIADSYKSFKWESLQSVGVSASCRQTPSTATGGPSPSSTPCAPDPEN